MARVAVAIVLLAALLADLRSAPPTAAVFTSSKSNPANTLATGALAAPTGLTATPAGRDVSVAFTPAAGATGTQVLYGRPAAGSSSCSGVTLALDTTSTASPVSDTPASAPQGTYACYAARSVRASWTSLASAGPVAVQTGVVVTSVVATNGGNPSGCLLAAVVGRVDCGDTLVVTFNQPIDPATGPQAGTKVCTSPTYGLRVGMPSTTTDCSQQGSLGRVPGAVANRYARSSANVTWNAARTQLTVDVRGLDGLQHGSITGATSTDFVPTTDATKLLSATGAQHVCDADAAGSDCLVAVQGTL